MMKKINMKLWDEKDYPDLKGISQLIGHRILDIGIYPGRDVEGGLTIDYECQGKIKRIILGFTELGIWVDWHGVKGKLNSEDILGQKAYKLVDDYNVYYEFEGKKDECSFSDFCEITDDPLRLKYHIKYINLWNEVHEFDISIQDIYKINNPRLLELFNCYDKDWNEILDRITSYHIFHSPIPGSED